MSYLNNNPYPIEAAYQLDKLLTQEIDNPQTLKLRSLTEEIATAFERTLQVWKAKNVIWKHLEIEIDYGAELLCRTLQAVNEASLFESISINVWGECPEDLQILCSFEANNHRLTRLKLIGMNLTLPNIQPMARTLRFSRSLRELSFNNRCHGVMLQDEEFLNALASNVSLESINLLSSLHDEDEFPGMMEPDVIYSANVDTSFAITALASHPNLKKLEAQLTLPSNNWGGIPNLLASSASRLEVLSFHFREEASVTMEPLLRALGQNTGLKSLEMYNFISPDERPFCDLLRTWQSHPTLQSIEMNTAFTNEDILAALDVQEFQRHVSFSNYPFGCPESDEQEAALLRLLRKQPKLSFANPYIGSETLRYQSYLNKKGRYLIFNNQNIPEGLLPLILAKVNRFLPKSEDDHFDESKDSYMESALYEHLHSTVFLQRSLAK